MDKIMTMRISKNLDTNIRMKVYNIMVRGGQMYLPCLGN
jgi:hypothetical protein